jgi:hypothetical protein
MTMYTVYEVKTVEGAYVGVTTRPLKTRLIELQHTRGFNGTIRALVEFEHKAEALALERELRPNYRMELNRAKGGARSGGGIPRFGSTNTMAKRVCIEGIEYSTLTDAGKTLGMKKTAVHYRLSSPYFQDWRYLTPPHAQYWNTHFARRQRIPAISTALQGRLS